MKAMVSKESVRVRIRGVRSWLGEQGIGCLVVTQPANISYITGFSGEDSWAIVGPRSVYLVTDSRYTEQARGQCPDCGIIERSGALADAVAEVVRKFRSVKTCGVETSMSISAYNSLKKNIPARIKTASGIVEEMRSCKDGHEIRALRKAAKIANGALTRIWRYVKAGVTENELAGRLDFEIRRLGSVNSFDTIVAFGANASRPHHQPGKRKLRTNDTMLIDWGAKYQGYCSDLTRCFTIGKTSGFYQRIYKVVEQAQAAAINMVKAGVEIVTVDAAAREIIRKNDLPVYGHGTGHGLGLEVHEAPVVSAKPEGKLQAGQIITIEPGVYIPGKLGIRIEDNVVVTASGCEVLSRF